MQRTTGELRQTRKGATVARISVCRRVPGRFLPSMDIGYQVIARRWRPRQFDELVGQDHIVRTLKNAISRQRIAHAYLFVGPRGTGKTSCARVFAKALNCEEGPTISPPNDSPLCESIMNGNCMDVIEIDGASNNSVDQVRDLREDCQYAPAQCRFKIYIIDEVHMLSTQAFNALLKTLEEPPSHVKFIFATTESHKVLPTIVSRCQRFEFRPIPDDVIAKRLVEIAETENTNMERNAVYSIARLANGGMRDAQSILDQMISFCGDSITEKDVLDVYGLASPDRIEAIAKALATAQYRVLITLIEELALEGRDLYRVLVDLQSFIRQALLLAIRNSGTTDKLGHPLTTESLMRMLDTLQAGEYSVKMGLSEKVNFEVTLLKAVEASRRRAIDSLIKELSGIAPELSKESPKKKTREAPGGIGVGEKAESPVAAEKPVTSETGASTSIVDHVGEATEREGADSVPPEECADEEPMPRLEDLVARLPDSTRKILEEKLRAQFRGVRRYNPEELV